MKLVYIALAALTLSFSAGNASAQQTKEMSIGDGLPRYGESMKNATDGSEIPYYKAADKNGLLVMFSCNTCPFVIKNQETTMETIEYAQSNGVGVVILNSNEAKRGGDDSYGAMKDYGKEQGYDVPYLVDENASLADMFGANHTPEVFLFNNQNKLVYKGAMNDNPRSPENAKLNYVANAIDAMVSGKKIDPETTKSIGCSIKRSK